MDGSGALEYAEFLAGVLADQELLNDAAVGPSAAIGGKIATGVGEGPFG